MTTQARDSGGWPYPAFRFGPTHVVPYTDVSAQIPGTIGGKTTLVLLWSDTDCHVAVGADPTATTNSKPITAKADTPVVVNPGDKVAAVRFQDSGTLYVTELL